MDPTFEHLLTGSDEESRAGPDTGDWRLNPSVFFKGPSIMAIGSRCICLSIECPADKFISWRPQPQAMRVNAFNFL